MRYAVPFAVLGLTVAAALAADPNFKLSNPDAPIEYSANDCSADAKQGELVCSGNVVIRQGEVRLRADAVRIHAPDNHTVDTVYAKGHVVIDAPSGTATGDSGVYDVTPRLVHLSGRVVLVKEDSVIRGETLNIDLVSGIAKLGGTEPGGAEKGGGRIQGLFTPKNQDNSKK
jgi:lipopolysaccharide export system protein LptA